MRILICQAENSFDDEAEFRDGILMGLADELSPEEISRALSRVMIAMVNDRTGADLANLLDYYLTEYGPFDMVILDPMFGYIRGDVCNNADVAEFIRHQLTPVVTKHNIGLIIIHHTNKPLRGAKEELFGSAFSYDYAGGAELINAARCSMQLRNIGSPTLFQLTAAKRGGRLGWRDGDGNLVYHKHISHDSRPGVISWREATDEEIAAVLPSNAKKTIIAPPNEILNLISLQPGRNQAWYCREARLRYGCTSNTIQNRIKQLLIARLIDPTKRGRDTIYRPTKKGSDCLEGYEPEIDWGPFTEETT